MNFDDLQNPELQEKVKACKTPEEVLALAKEEGYADFHSKLPRFMCESTWSCRWGLLAPVLYDVRLEEHDSGRRRPR